MNIRAKLFELQDIEYRDFHSRLMPTVDKERVIGIRVPLIKKLAKEISNTPDACEFLKALPHKYYEEDNLHAFLISEEKNFDKCIDETNKFLPYINNWATCDSFKPKCFKLNTDRLLEYIYEWTKSDKTYVIRFGIGMLMLHYLDEHFDPEYLDYVSKIESEEYYVNMMIAWYFATALAKQYDYAVEILQTYKLPVWIHNKTIQKAVESYRITDEKKNYLKTLRVKM